MIASLIVDHFPRNKLLAVGILGCMTTLIIEAALIASFVDSTNSAALQAAVAFLFIFEIPYDFCLNGRSLAFPSQPSYYGR